MPVVTKFPSANQAAGSPFNGAWTNPNNAHADDGSYATAAPGKNQEFASVWSVPFSTSDIPNGSTVNSVTVEVQWKVSTTSSVATLRSTAFADSAQTTVVSASPGLDTTSEPTSDTIQTYAATPSLAQLRDLWVRAQVLRGNSNTAVTGSLDYLKVTVNYTDPPPATTGTGSVSTPTASASVAAKETFQASGSPSAPVATVSGTGAERFTGSASASAASPTASGSGELISSGVTGTASVSAPAVQSEIAGTMRFTGSGSVSSPIATAGSDSAIRFIGPAGVTARPISAEAEGQQFLAIVASGAVSARSAQSQASGFFGSGFTGSADVTAPHARARGDVFCCTVNGPWISHGTVHLGRKPNH